MGYLAQHQVNTVSVRKQLLGRALARFVPNGSAQANPRVSTNKLDTDSGHATYKVYSIGNHQPDEPITFIESIEDALGPETIKNLLPMQPSDVVATGVPS